jgi:hypothetical protein
LFFLFRAGFNGKLRKRLQKNDKNISAMCTMPGGVAETPQAAWAFASLMVINPP